MKNTAKELPIPGIQAQLEEFSQAFSPPSWFQAQHGQKMT